MQKHYRYFIGGLATIFIPAGFIILIGFIFTLALADAFTVSDKSDLTIITNETSPDQKYIATTFSLMGGGAAGWCSKKVSVRKSEESFNENDFVFRSNCGTDVKTEWKNQENLHITYFSDSDVFSTTQRKWSADRAINITYTEKQRF